MIKLLKKLFSRKSQQSSEIKQSISDKYNVQMMNHQQEGIFIVWEETNEIDDLSDHIQHLMEVRNKKVQDRADLVILINKQRSILGLEEIDEEGMLPSQCASDEDYALES